MLDDSKEAGIGHNSGADLPYDLTKFQPLELRAREIADAGAAWIKLDKIETETKELWQKKFRTLMFEAFWSPGVGSVSPSCRSRMSAI